ncbi:hypothetical protein EDB73_101862 [Vibrio crassostreae]|nr:hypothetical protein EDB73_101862 [Vibrio crassostreae]TCT43393.1 hypothetical protein EDB29_101198 [Vibrio crassostreae]TCV63164.1 hypothetical protein EDB74_103201 [Vibrio crassostreae]
MITCYVRYVIDPKKVNEFETYAKMWIPLVVKFGGPTQWLFLTVGRGEQYCLGAVYL